ncbi:MAG: metallophosphoesterase [Dictyoglomus sp.]|nr:metallophosphoesterase [Dictyoglomus sp.]MCX7942058.1 metallophosphoesterase [Dictyoglomaceae bacterium]MDW8187949.1 metallophosphoesterase family protein [Dictyoglomus sp.]
MVKIGVISDTHLPSRSPFLPPIILEKLHGVEMILHAGDWEELFFLKELEKIAPVYGVQGNMDSLEVKKKFPVKRIIEVENIKIGLIHGGGSPFGIKERIKKEFLGEEVKAIVFGHTHHALMEWDEDIFFFNPGSPTDKIFTTKNSIGFLYVDKDKVWGEIVEL